MSLRFSLVMFAVCGLVISAAAQPGDRMVLAPVPAATPPPVSQIAEPPAQLPPISRERRQQAYAKLLEGQRHLWRILNTPGGDFAANVRLARAALQKSVELNPGLAESYAALAELSFWAQSNFVETERLASIAVRLDADNFSGRRFLAWVYTIQSGIYEGTADKDKTAQAIAAWREITRLDRRNAEAWAFLSDLYERTNQTAEHLEALEKWSGASAPMDERFYKSLAGEGRSLSPDFAAAGLGRALFKAGRFSEAVAALVKVLAENPSDEETLNALEAALEKGSAADSERAVAVLMQAVAASPANPSLLQLLTNAQIRANRIDEAVKILRETSARLADTDKATAAYFLAQAGEVYADAGRDKDAVALYEQSLQLLGIANLPLMNEIERDFAARILPRLVAVYRGSSQIGKARETISRLSALLGTNDATADLQLIELLRATGDNKTALQIVRESRQRFQDDVVLLRIEAEILTDTGKVDDAVNLIRPKIINKTRDIAVPTAVEQDFRWQLTISTLFRRAGRGEEAIAAANAAMQLAQSSQMTNDATQMLATAQNAAGDFKAAEVSLRGILRREPNNATALNNLGYYMVERGERLPEAVELIKRAVEIQPLNASFLDSLGWAYFKSGQLAEAELNLNEAARRNPNSASIREHLGDLYHKQNKPEQAKAAWRKAVNLTKTAADAEKIRNKLNH